MKRWTITAKYECTAYLLHGPLQRRVVDAPIYMMEGCSLRMTILGDDGPACKRPSICRHSGTSTAHSRSRLLRLSNRHRHPKDCMSPTSRCRTALTTQPRSIRHTGKIPAMVME
jgi:hypothetical protein